MNLESVISIYCGGPGSGCHGENCGRPASAVDLVHRENVEMVPTKNLAQFRDLDRRKTPIEPGKLDRLKQQIRKEGIKQPIVLYYDHNQKKALVGDGNHRLTVALELGIKEVPVRVVKYNVYNRGSKVSGFHNGNKRVPGVMKPSQIGLVGHLAACADGRWKRVESRFYN